MDPDIYMFNNSPGDADVGGDRIGKKHWYNIENTEKIVLLCNILWDKTYLKFPFWVPQSSLQWQLLVYFVQISI